MLEAVADYASISLVNARLFQALEARAQRLEQQIQGDPGSDTDPRLLSDVHRSVRAAQAELATMMNENKEMPEKGRLTTIQEDLDAILEKLSKANTTKKSQT
jgi:hypothetical protein